MIIFKTPAQIKIMAEAGRRLAQILQILKDEVGAGVSTMFLEKRSRELIEAAGAKPAFLNYRPTGGREAYPFSLCVSLNDTVVHGRPSDYIIKEGDLVKLDLGLKYKGFYVDSAVTVGVGEILPLTGKLMRVTEEALGLAVKETRPGGTLGDIGAAVEEYVKKNRLEVVRGLTGHGIGQGLHEEPSVFNFGRRGEGEKLEVGMVLAIEPMIATGIGRIKQLPDDSFVTADGSLAAHFEHTVAITPDGPRILTRI